MDLSCETHQMLNQMLELLCHQLNPFDLLLIVLLGPINRNEMMIFFFMLLLTSTLRKRERERKKSPRDRRGREKETAKFPLD